MTHVQLKITQIGPGLGKIGFDLFEKRGFSKFGFKTRRQYRERSSIVRGSFKAETNSNTLSSGGRGAKELAFSVTSLQVEDFSTHFLTPVATPATRSCSSHHFPSSHSSTVTILDGSPEDKTTCLTMVEKEQGNHIIES